MMLMIPALSLITACSKSDDTAAAPVWDDPPASCDDAIRVPVDGGPTVGDAGAADDSEAALGDSPVPTQINLGFPGDPSTTAGFTWQTDADTLVSQVELYTGAYEPVVIEGQSFIIDQEPDDPVRIHEVHLCGLDPATTYTARVGGDGAWSQPRDFTTAPPAGDPGPVRIAVVGDNNLGYVEWGIVVASILGHDPDVLVHTGDVLHDGHHEAEWEAWFEEANGLVGQVPMVVAHGNHDERAALYFAHVLQPGNETWFSFDWGPAHVVILDSEQEDEVRRGEEATLLDEDLAATDAPWTFAAHHRPAYASGEASDTRADGGEGGSQGVREAWCPIYDAHHLDMVLNGHWHLYERTVPIVDGQEAPSTGEGTTYVITGGGGALPTSCGESWFTAVCESTFHYVILDVDAAQLTLTAYRDDGTVLDTLTVPAS